VGLAGHGGDQNDALAGRARSTRRPAPAPLIPMPTTVCSS
jgi:hypothetical protein